MKNAADCRGEQSTALQAFGAERSNQRGLYFTEDGASFAWVILFCFLITIVGAVPFGCVIVIRQFQ